MILFDGIVVYFEINDKLKEYVLLLFFRILFIFGGFKLLLKDS